MLISVLSLDGRFGVRRRARIAAFVMLVLVATLVNAQSHATFDLLYVFNQQLDGVNPYGALVADSAGNLYGATVKGGMYGAGTVYKIDAGGNESILYNFTGAKDGKFPESTLLLDQAGNLYGTTLFGGSYGGGTVFKLDTANNESVLY